jgi:hypothetical protein
MWSHHALNLLSKRYHNSYTHAKHHGYNLRKSGYEGGTLIMHAGHDSTYRHIDEPACYETLQYHIVTRSLQYQECNSARCLEHNYCNLP